MAKYLIYKFCKLQEISNLQFLALCLFYSNQKPNKQRHEKAFLFVLVAGPEWL